MAPLDVNGHLIAIIRIIFEYDHIGRKSVMDKMVDSCLRGMNAYNQTEIDTSLLNQDDTPNRIPSGTYGTWLRQRLELFVDDRTILSN